jgi:hypothetical protein
MIVGSFDRVATETAHDHANRRSRRDGEWAEETPVGRMTWNVLFRYLDEKPLRGQQADA